MTARRSRQWLIRGVLALVGAVGLWVAWSAERRSMERANRLQRQGQVQEAAALYEARALSDPADPELRYNLGTALTALDDPDARIELERATPTGPTEVRGRAHYNIGLVELRSAIDAAEPDSARAGAAAAIEANRAALRLRPGDPDTKWNLAMALRLLDSIDAFERRSGRELTDGAVEADVVTRSVNVPDAEEDERAEDPPAEGERETVAVAGDESPLPLEEALALLGTTHHDPTTMLQKLIALEGRMRAMTQRGGAARRW